ncbi:MAG: glycoside hydrolase family 97 catalytic domain-containing protein [Actinomycetota bacterium]
MTRAVHRIVAGCVVAGVFASCSADDRGRDAHVFSAPPTERAGADEIADPAVTASPDESLRIEMGLLDDGALVYRVLRQPDPDRSDGDLDEVVVDTSPIGLDTSAGSFLDGLTVVDSGDASAWSSSFTLPTGKRRSSTIEGTQRTIRLASADSDLHLEVDVVAVDHAVAFRSRLIEPDPNPGGADGAGDHRIVTVTAERTGFDLAVDSTAWLQPHDEASSFTPAYERIALPGRPLVNPIPSRQGWTLPALFEHDGTWTLLAEAGLESGWAGSHLSGIADDGDLALALPDSSEGYGVGLPEPVGPLPLESPWRVLMVSTDVGDVVESDLIRHLSAAADDRDWSWVEPGRVSWSWWADNDSPTDPDRLIEYIDLSAELGWEYSLVDANWNELPDDEFDRVVAHAEQAGVGLLLWYNSGGSHNDVTEAPRGLMSDRDVRRAEMARLLDLGIRGVKVDFFHSDKPDRIRQYLDILADAADFELLVNFHGSTVPRGWGRTWPNLMTMEAVAGGEQYLFNQAYAGLAPAQNTVLPFVRNVVGPMDFTPTSLDPDQSRATTNAHELALAVVFESGLQHLIDRPETYLDQPEVVRSILADLPVAWDDTVLVDGRPDAHVVIARRTGDTWWIGAINGSDEELELDLDALFAADDRLATAMESSSVRVACDGDDPRTFATDTSAELPDRIRLAAFGGCVLVAA